MSHTNPLAPHRYEAEPQAIFNYPKYWAECFGPAPLLSLIHI